MKINDSDKLTTVHYDWYPSLSKEAIDVLQSLQQCTSEIGGGFECLSEPIQCPEYLIVLLNKISNW